MLLFKHIGEEASGGWEEDSQRQGKVTPRAEEAAPSGQEAPGQGSQFVKAFEKLREEGRLDQQSLEARFPVLTSTADLFSSHDQDRLRRLYDSYCQEISPAEMAASMETCLFLCRMAEAMDADRVLDTGSGFSSVALRYFAERRRPRMEIRTVDSDPTWLEKTKGFLTDHSLGSDTLYLWDEFKALSWAPNLIFHDMGQAHDTRPAYLEQLLQWAPNDTVFILDDMHYGQYQQFVRQKAEEIGRRWYNLICYTEDAFHRFAGLLAAGRCSDI